ncbi:MAG: ABC transporter ATP-binding protein, partial [Clostridia bacterium]|nr:ABC transporter ATP-binding protein [Clostridia bacterium]
MAARTLEQLREQYKGTSSKGGKKGPGGPGGPGGRHFRPSGKPKNLKPTISKLLHYVGMYKGRLIFALVCMLLSTGASLAGSYVLRPVINGLVDSTKTVGQRMTNLVITLCVMVAIYVVGVVFTYLQQRIMISVSQGAIERIRNDLFDKVQTLPVRFYDNNPTGEVMSRFTNDVDNIGQMLDGAIVSLISGSITLVGTFVMMVYTNIWLTLITVVFTPIFIFGGQAIARASRKYYSAQQAALGAVNGYIEETVSGAKVIKVFNHEGECEQEFAALNDDLKKKQMG